MINIDTGTKKTYKVVEKILLEKNRNQAHVYFEILGNGNVGLNPLPSQLQVSYIIHLSDNDRTQAN